MQNKDHSLYSPSKAHRFMRCPGSIALEYGIEDTGSSYAQEGTAAHKLAEMVLTKKIVLAEEMIGRSIKWVENGKEVSWEITESIANDVQSFCQDVYDRIEHLQETGDFVSIELRVEQRIDLSAVKGIPGQFGTADVIIAAEDRESGKLTIIVLDLKFGRGVEVEAQGNEQLMDYGAGVVDEYELAGYEIEGILVAVNQVRLGHISEAWYSPEQIRDFVRELRVQVGVAQNGLELYQKSGNTDDLVLNPGEKQCRFCKALATCPAARELVSSSIYGGKTPVTSSEFEDLDDEKASVEKVIIECEQDRKEIAAWLGASMDKIDFIESWCKAVRSEVFKLLNLGTPIPGYKMVAGRKGNREWEDAKEAEEVLKSMRLKQQDMYSMKLISPTQAEKILKGNPRRWKKVQPLITRKDGPPSVAPESDKRPAINVSAVADEFEDLPPENFEDMV